MANDVKYSVFQHYGTNAERLAFTPAPAAAIQPIYLWYETDTGSLYLYYTTWVLIAGAGTIVYVDPYGAIYGDGTIGSPLGVNVDGTSIGINEYNQLEFLGGADVLPFVNDYRLTLTSNTPVTTSDVTSSSDIFITPYIGQKIALYTGSSWVYSEPGQKTLALSSLTSGLPYDVFFDYNGGTPIVAILAWTSTTARATALTTQDGILVLTGALDWRYIGTIKTISTSATADFAGGSTTQVGGQRYCWNYYHRVIRPMRQFDSDNTWNYNTATWRQMNSGGGANGNMVECVVGVVEDRIRGSFVSQGQGSAANVLGSISIGLNSTSTPSRYMAIVSGGSSPQNASTVLFNDFPRLGYNFLVPLEIGNGVATMTWYGDANVAYVQSGMEADVLG